MDSSPYNFVPFHSAATWKHGLAQRLAPSTYHGDALPSELRGQGKEPLTWFFSVARVFRASPRRESEPAAGDQTRAEK
jgi:hypothetical protein